MARTPRCCTIATRRSSRLSGNLLDLLDDGELAAVIGHELTHHRLWSLDGGRFLVADRLLDALARDRAHPGAVRRDRAPLEPGHGAVRRPGLRAGLR